MQITLFSKNNRVSFTPGCSISHAFALAKNKKYISYHDLDFLRLMGFAIIFKNFPKENKDL